MQHDVIYKQPKDIRVTDTMNRMVDATNGMAITTDILFRELERSLERAKAEADKKSKLEKEKPSVVLFEYCFKGDVDGVRKVLGQEKPDLCWQSDDGQTALYANCLS